MNDGSVSLKSELGNYMLEVDSGSSDSGANIQIYETNGSDAQKFIIGETSQSDVYVIGTMVTNGYKVLDVERESTTDGSNVCQWENGERPNQTWVFESTSAPRGQEQENNDSCWSLPLGYACCSSSIDVIFTDDDGQWAIEKDNWCGLQKNCNKQLSCTAQGYPCCKYSNIVYFEDSDGKWSVENDEWCLIV